MLFARTDLVDLLKYQVDESAAVMAERIVAGWFAELGLDYSTPLGGRPDEYGVPPQVFSWAVELGGLVYENPTSMTTDATADQSQAWKVSRRDEILAAARAYARRTGVEPDQGASALVPAPTGRFPRPLPYPDPADGRRRGGCS